MGHVINFITYFLPKRYTVNTYPNNYLLDGKFYQRKKNKFKLRIKLLCLLSSQFQIADGCRHLKDISHYIYMVFLS